MTGRASQARLLIPAGARDGLSGVQVPGEARRLRSQLSYGLAGGG